MNTFITTTHEESFIAGDNKTNKTIGIMTNIDHDGKRIDSFPYIFREDDIIGTYIFFNTIIDMMDYHLYGDKKVKRAYMKEDELDNLYDNNLNRVFNDYLKWIDGSN